jgi:hypothetical protein
VRTLDAGPFSVIVRDRSTADDFHLKGPGVNRRTSVKGKGTFLWRVRLKPGKYRYGSDADGKLRKSFSVRL